MAQGSQEQIERLLALLDADDTAQEGVQLLIQAGTQALKPVLAKLKSGFAPAGRDHRDWEDDLRSIVVHIGTPSVPILIDALSDEEGHLQIDAAWMLGSISDARAVEPLINALNSKEKFVRWAVIHALGYFDDPQIVEPLLVCLRDEDSLVRWSAGEELSKRADSRIEAELERMSHENDTDLVRQAAMLTLQRIRERRSPTVVTDNTQSDVPR